LRQVDFDGQFSITEEVRISCNATGRHEVIGIYPNPASSHVNIDLNLSQPGSIEITLFNSIGQCVLREAFRLKNGFQKIELDLSALPADVYQLNLGTELSISTKKVVKL
jgi:hypothetical protein